MNIAGKILAYVFVGLVAINYFFRICSKTSDDGVIWFYMSKFIRGLF